MIPVRMKFMEIVAASASPRLPTTLPRKPIGWVAQRKMGGPYLCPFSCLPLTLASNRMEARSDRRVAALKLRLKFEIS